VVQLLLSAHAEVNSATNYGDTPLSEAAMNGHSKVVQLLLDAHVEVYLEDEFGNTP
jgi:ankyrin repeat protein